jgi:hypothetical protein
MTLVSFKDVKKLVNADFERMNAFTNTDKFKFMKFKNPKRSQIIYHDLVLPGE